MGNIYILAKKIVGHIDYIQNGDKKTLVKMDLSINLSKMIFWSSWIGGQKNQRPCLIN
jgi:hypothetical protein